MKPMDEDRESYLNAAVDVAELHMAGGKGIEGAMRLLRDHQVSLDDSIEVVMRVTGRSRPDCARLVRTSATWRDSRPAPLS